MQTNTFKRDKLWGVHDFRIDVFKIALFTQEKTSDEEFYTSVGEVSAEGYTEGGLALTTLKNGEVEDGVAIVSFADVEWPDSTITATHAMVYNSSKADRAICVLDLGGEITSSSEKFTIKFPPGTPNEAFHRET